ncbi:MAG: adenylosuccinate lyase family protein [Gammaproteobacteria bacterium]|nr:adenylosuccinate lyase family protein [Gammaproteobacteria bacterium]
MQADDLFTETARWQSWLDVEAELALAQAEVGMIPDWAARQIAEAARIEALDLDRLRQEIATTMAPVMALTRVLGEAAGEAGSYVHWGATTQNVIDTGRLLVLRRFHAGLREGVAGALQSLSALAEEHAETVMVGRTNRQHALPITFGFKVAGWVEDLIRIADQLEELEDRLFQLRFGGAIGAYQSFGGKGPELAHTLARRLELGMALVPNRTGTAPLVEYLTCLARLGMAVGRIADELYLLMQQEIGEVREDLGLGVVGSSTMPHKTNPKLVVGVRARANLLRGQGAAALSVPPSTHEGDAAVNRELTLLIEETCPAAARTVADLCNLLARTVPDAEQMRANVMLNYEFMATESLMMHLAPSLGRARAHDLMHELADRARDSGTPLRQLLEEDPRIAEHLSPDDIAGLLDPERNVGESPAIAREAAAAGRRRAAALLRNQMIETDAARSSRASRSS